MGTRRWVGHAKQSIPGCIFTDLQGVGSALEDTGKSREILSWKDEGSLILKIEESHTHTQQSSFYTMVKGLRRTGMKYGTALKIHRDLLLACLPVAADSAFASLKGK